MSRRRIVVLLVLLVLVAAGWQAVALTADMSLEAPDETIAVEQADEDVSDLIAYNGSDVSRILRDGTVFAVCDEESDENLVRAMVDTEIDGTTTRSEVEDPGGSDGQCVGVSIGGTALRHRICERNLLTWTCGNWQAG